VKVQNLQIEKPSKYFCLFLVLECGFTSNFLLRAILLFNWSSKNLLILLPSKSESCCCSTIHVYLLAIQWNSTFLPSYFTIFLLVCFYNIHFIFSINTPPS
jgi:hypothetical protein